MDHGGSPIDCFLRLDLLVIHQKWDKAFELAMNLCHKLLVLMLYGRAAQLTNSLLRESKSLDLRSNLAVSSLQYR